MPARPPRVSPVMAASRPLIGDRHARRQPVLGAHNIGDDLCNPFSHIVGSCSHPLWHGAGVSEGLLSRWVLGVEQTKPERPTFHADPEETRKGRANCGA
jgi:hypothetical protein